MLATLDFSTLTFKSKPESWVLLTYGTKFEIWDFFLENFNTKYQFICFFIELCILHPKSLIHSSLSKHWYANYFKVFPLVEVYKNTDKPKKMVKIIIHYLSQGLGPFIIKTFNCHQMILAAFKIFCCGRSREKVR